MKRIILYYAILMLCMTFGCSSSHDDGDETKPSPEEKKGTEDDGKGVTTISLTEAQKGYVEHGNEFALRLFCQTASKGGSMAQSPLSVASLLGMLVNGADDETLTEILTVLGMGDIGAGDVNAYFSTLLTAFPKLDSLTEVTIGNGIFVSHSHPLLSEFSQTVAKAYGAEVASLDFSTPEALTQINSWASKVTQGKIDGLMSQTDPLAVVIAVNAVYFKGEWMTRFNAEETSQEVFGATGRQVQMMHRKGKMAYGENDTCQIVSLPYGNGAFSMTVMLPREQVAMNQFLDLLDKEHFALWNKTQEEKTIDLKLPRFEADSENGLNSDLSALGLSSVFASQPGFNRMCSDVVFVSDFRQKVRVIVDEEGSEAAAATSDTVVPISVVDAQMHVNRPFVYVISEQSTGAILFIGVQE